MRKARCRKCGEICVAMTVEAFTCDNCDDEYHVVREPIYSQLETELDNKDRQLVEARAEIERLREKIKGCHSCKHCLPENEMVEVCLNEAKCCRTTSWRVVDRTTSAQRESWPDLWEEEL